MKKTLPLILFCSFRLTGMMSCDNKKNKDDVVTSNVKVPEFSADSAFLYVKKQTDFGPRVPNSEAHAGCAAFLEAELARFCDTVVVQSFDVKAYDGTVLHSKNIMGRFSPENSRRIILASHWDSRPFADHDSKEANRSKPIDGANDGASGVGVLLEIARQLSMKNPGIGIDILFFDAEDYGTPSSVDLPGDWWGLGSQYWAKQAAAANYQAEFGILLDMVGASDATFYHESFSAYYASDVVSKVWGTANKLGYGQYFINEAAHPITDDHLYVNKYANIKMIDIIHQDKKSGTGFSRVWHTLDDNINNIDKNTLHVVGTTLLAVVESL